MASNPKDLHRTITETPEELDDIFTWREPRRVSKSLTISYDKCIYILKNIEQNQSLIGKYIEFLEYPDATVAIAYQARKINYSIYDKFSQLNQTEVVDNKRNRSQKIPSRRAQKTAVQQRILNPVLDLGMSCFNYNSQGFYLTLIIDLSDFFKAIAFFIHNSDKYFILNFLT